MIDLKEEIKSRGLTQDQFAQKAGVNRSTVQKAIYGYYVKPETAQKFCDALCIPYDPEDWCLRQRKPTEKPISRNITDKTIEHFKNGLKVGQNVKVPYNAQSTDSRNNKILKARLGCAIIESNNGGRGFARNVERIMKDDGNFHTTVKWFHQSQNKRSRILSNSASVMNNVLFPVNWMDKWPDFSTDILRYQKEGKNLHDDAPDCLTGVYENPKPKGQTKLNRGISGGI